MWGKVVTDHTPILTERNIGANLPLFFGGIVHVLSHATSDENGESAHLGGLNPQAWGLCSPVFSSEVSG